jgi:hypothetical protein
MPLVLACFDGSNTVEDARVETRSAAAMEPGELARKHSGGNGERKVNGISDSAVTSLGRIEIHVIRLVLAVRAVFFQGKTYRFQGEGPSGQYLRCRHRRRERHSTLPILEQQEKEKTHSNYSPNLHLSTKASSA